MLPIRRYPRPLICVFGSLVLTANSIRKENELIVSGLSCHNIFAHEAGCFASTLQLHLLQNYPAPWSSRTSKEVNMKPEKIIIFWDYYLYIIIFILLYYYLYIIFFLMCSAFKLFNSVCPHFPPPFTPIMWLTPTKRIDRHRESCGSLRIAECARPTTSRLRIDKVATSLFKKKAHRLTCRLNVLTNTQCGYYKRLTLLKMILMAFRCLP